MLYNPKTDNIPWDRIEAEADAVIFIPNDQLQNNQVSLSRIGQKIPLVMLQNRYTTFPDIPRIGDVTVNAQVAGAMAAEFLFLCGSRKTAIITGYQNAWIHQENISGCLGTAQT